MIGVVAREEQQAAVHEFFELFKTPWRLHNDSTSCDVLICSDAGVRETSASLVIVYGAREQDFDVEHGLESGEACESGIVAAGSDRIPIYCGLRAFGSSADQHFIELTSAGQTFIRIGFDLFAEVTFLLTQGQPKTHSRIPTLDLHIAFLRELILQQSIPLREIPPVPAGYNFIACLTHDIDHPRVKHHLGDLTMFGFLFRALIWWIVDLARGRQTLRQVAVGWRAAVLLPFVYVGLAKDFWDVFDRYLEIESGVTSTFFVIPTKGDPGEDPCGRRRSKRAASYEAADIAGTLHMLLAAKREIAVHGIDAWRDAGKGRAELARVQRVTGGGELGVRMHWLYFNEKSPVFLEQAGYSYDSTFGYNDAVGYRAGTTQAYRPLGTKRLLELPMNVMDTALFYQSYMNLSPSAARAEIGRLIDNAARFGGVLTINWHDRSLAPERMWDDFYIELVEELKRRGAWLPTAAEAVAWFRERRSIRMDEEAASVELQRHDGLPALQLTAHQPASRHVPRLGKETAAHA